MSTLVDVLVDAFEMQVKGNKPEKEIKEKLTQEMINFLKKEGDLNQAIKKAYRSYMDAEAPEAWVGAAERKLKAYCNL
jgi:predicted DNA-binding ArsR family transcriptional regulator